MKKILIVDNMKLLAEKEKSILSRQNFTIFTASSGEEALKIHKEEKVDLIIADLDMPGMAGDELCSIIRRDESLRKVSVIITCYNKKTAAARCEASGANACIIKPVVTEALFRKVNELLSIPERESLRVLIKVSVKGKVKSDYFFATSQNISVSGILLETGKMLVKGGIITCSFFLDTHQITTDGEVMRLERKSADLNYYGVKFNDLTPHFRSYIENFVKKYRTRGG